MTSAIQLLQYNLANSFADVYAYRLLFFQDMLPCNDFLGEAFKYFCVKHFS